jgi:hypothetical protein
MNEHENELARASATNGAFDPEKAKRLTPDAVSRFHSRLKWAGRITWIYLLICVAVILFAWNEFQAASSTKAIVGFGILMLAAYEGTILIKLWYWIANTKVTLLKELKQWQLQTALSSTIAPSVLEGGTSRRFGLSRAEWIAWCVAVMLVALLTASNVVQHSVETPVTPATIGDYVTLKADGAATSLMKGSDQAGSFVGGAFDFTFGQPERVKAVRWLDDRGRELPFDVAAENGQRHYTIRLIEPVMPHEWQRITQITEYRWAATKKGDVWTHTNDYQFGYARNEYSVTVELPRAAKLVAADPAPVAQWTCNGVERVAFRATRGPNEPFRYKIEYRLRDEAGNKKMAPAGGQLGQSHFR